MNDQWPGNDSRVVLSDLDLGIVGGWLALDEEQPESESGPAYSEK